MKFELEKKRTSGDEIRYHVADDTKIANILLKKLLPHTETKQQLTIYLSEYVISEIKRLGIDYVVSYDLISKTNRKGLEILHDSHEEADTLLIIHFLEIARRNPFNQCNIHCPDTDVFLLLIFHYPSLPNALIFRTGKGSN